jgi:hypothetical protein
MAELEYTMGDVRETGRGCGVWTISAVILALASCSRGAFPETIDFGAKRLTKANTWARGGLSGVVYVPPGQTLPEASPQVGVIISTEHITADLLHSWIREQFHRSHDLILHESGSADQACKVGVTDRTTRVYMAVQVCKTGVARAACVEADEPLDESVWVSCTNKPSCFENLCDLQLRDRRETLDLLAADFLTRR